jgi:hypothetical protein
MRVLFVLVILVLLGIASAETIQFGNYTATFDMKQPHINDNSNSSDRFRILTLQGIIVIYMNTTSASLGVYPVDDSIMISGNKYSVGIIEKGGSYLFYNQNSFISSRMNLTSTLDFLKTLKIEKTKAT